MDVSAQTSRHVKGARRLNAVLDTLRDMSPHIENVRTADFRVGARGMLRIADYRDPGNSEVVLRVVVKTMLSRLKWEKYMGQELAAWSRVSEHQNIVSLLGIYRDMPWGISMVCPYYEHHDMVAYLAANPVALRSTLILDVAKALDYIHTRDPPVIHNDVRAANIFIDAQRRACLGDFGLARIAQVDTSGSETSADSAQGNAHWTPPEVIAPTIPDDADFDSLAVFKSPALDIYAFGMVIYEAYSGRIPFAESDREFIVFGWVVNGRRPERPTINGTARPSSALWALTTQCWLKVPSDRPGPGTLAQRVQTAIQGQGGHD